MKKILTTLFFFVTAQIVSAQLTVDAGKDTTACNGNNVVLGSNPTAIGGNAPYTYQWSPVTNLSSDTMANPVATAIADTKYFLTVTDANNQTQLDSVVVHAKYHVNITVSDTDICVGQKITLTGSSGLESCLTATGIGNILSSVLGSNSIPQPGSAIQSPSLFGNILKSYRNQMLYKAVELQTALGGPKLIRVFFFKLAIFNSSSGLQNFSVKAGCASKDSLTDWENNLTEVYHSNLFTPDTSWMGMLLNPPIYWDGISDLVVDVCHYCPGTFGNQNNKATCSTTSFTSYLYSSGSTNQCSSFFAPTKSNIRPNIRFNYTTPITNPIPVIPTGIIYAWAPATGSGAVLNPNSSATSASPQLPVTYSLQVTDTSGCSVTDSISVQVRTNQNEVLFDVTNALCFGTTTGQILATLKANADSLNYLLIDSSNLHIYYYGIAPDSSTQLFSNIPAGVYHLLISDSICPSTDFPVTVTSYPALVAQPQVPQNVNCYSDSTGSECIYAGGGIPPYQYLWDSVGLQGSCYDSLTVGTYRVTVTDSVGCSKVSYPFNIVQILNNVVLSLAYDTIYLNASIAATVYGGTQPYTIYWGDSSAAVATYNGIHYGGIHTYYNSGVYYITLIDVYGCSVTDSVVVLITTGIQSVIPNPQFAIFPNPATSQLNITIDQTLLGAQLNIYNITGAVVLQSKIQNLNSKIECSAFPTGVYIAEIKNSTGTQRVQWVKM